MADDFHSHNNAALLSLLANGAQTNADFDFGKINKSYWEGLDQNFKNNLRDKLAAGLPKGPDGLPDYGQTGKILIEGGQFEPGINAAKLGIEQDKMNFGKGQSAGIQNFEGGGQPQQAPNLPSSLNRSGMAVVERPLNKGGEVRGATGPTSTGGDQVAGGSGLVTPVQFLDQLGIPPGYNREKGITTFRKFGINPDQTFDPNDPTIVKRLGPAMQLLKGSGQVQPPQPGDNPPQGQPQPQMGPQGGPQGAVALPPQGLPQVRIQSPPVAQGSQPAPVTNTLTATGAPQAPSRAQQGIAFYSGIMSDPRSPENNVAFAKARLEALQADKALTPEEKNYAQHVLQGYKGTMKDLHDEEDSKASQRAILTTSLLPKIDKSQEGATAARDDINSIHRARTELDAKGGVFSGSKADVKLYLSKAAELLGVPASDKIANTEAYGAAIGQRVASMVKAFGSGTAISDGDRRFAAAMAGGQVTLDEKSMRRILDIGEQAARGKIDIHNSLVDHTLSANEELKSAKDAYVVKAPGEYQKPAKADPYEKAREAIKAGAPRDAVMKRLKEFGHDPGKI